MIFPLGKHFNVSEIFTADYSFTDTDVLAECSSHCCAVVCSADHCNWSCAIWWVGLCCIIFALVIEGVWFYWIVCRLMGVLLPSNNVSKEFKNFT